jgi:DNA-binding MarR family transcriptional regulator
MAVNKRLALVGATLHEYGVLFRLTDEDEVPQHELAFDAAIDPGAASRLVRTMAEAGLLTTRVDPKDKRQRFVRITPKGRALEQTLTPVVDAAIEPYMCGLTPDEEEHFLVLLQKAHRGMLSLHMEGAAVDTRATAEEPRTPPKPEARAADLADTKSGRAKPGRAKRGRAKPGRTKVVGAKGGRAKPGGTKSVRPSDAAVRSKPARGSRAKSASERPKAKASTRPKRKVR